MPNERASETPIIGDTYPISGGGEPSTDDWRTIASGGTTGDASREIGDDRGTTRARARARARGTGPDSTGSSTRGTATRARSTKAKAEDILDKTDSCSTFIAAIFNVTSAIRGSHWRRTKEDCTEAGKALASVLDVYGFSGASDKVLAPIALGAALAALAGPSIVIEQLEKHGRETQENAGDIRGPDSRIQFTPPSYLNGKEPT